MQPHKKCGAPEKTRGSVINSMAPLCTEKRGVVSHTWKSSAVHSYIGPSWTNVIMYNKAMPGITIHRYKIIKLTHLN